MNDTYFEQIPIAIITEPVVLLLRRTPKINASAGEIQETHNHHFHVILVNTQLVSPLAIRKICDRHFGIGADGFVIVQKTSSMACQFSMTMYNPDGTKAEMCGNALRCVGAYLQERVDKEISEEESTYRILTGAGPMEVMVNMSHVETAVRIVMPSPVLASAEIPTLFPPNTEARCAYSANAVVKALLNVEVDNGASSSDSSTDNSTGVEVTCVSTGNPHCVVFLEGDTTKDGFESSRIQRIGTAIQAHPMFPKSVNVGFAQVLSPTSMKLVVWERGAGLTLACGTGACAAVVAAVLTGQVEADATVAVSLPGGVLQISWGGEEIVMSGPAQFVFAGEAPIPFIL